MKYRYLLGTLSLIIALLGCNLLSGAPSIGEAGSLLTNTPAQPVDAPLPLVTPLLTDTPAQPPVPTASEVQPPQQQQPAPQQPQPNPPTGCSGAPNISFTALPTTITVGESTTLSWTVTNADTVQIDNGIGSVNTSGSRPITLNAPGRTIFTLSARCGNSAITLFNEVAVDVNPQTGGNQAPAAPTNFRADGSGTNITFTWMDNSTNESGFEIYQDGVTIDRPGGTNTTGQRTVTVVRLCNTSASFIIRPTFTRPDGVTAFGSSSEPDDAVTVPCKPDLVSATGKAQGLVDIRFNDKSTNEQGFRVYVTGGDGSTRRTLNRLEGMPSGVDQTIGTYCNLNTTFYMTAYNDAGESDVSNTDSVTTIPCAPTSFIADGSGTTISHRWAMAANHTATGFQLYKVGSPHTKVGPVVTGTTNFRDDTGLFCNHTAAYFVRAVNSIGESENSNTDGAVTIPCAPSGFTVSGISKTEVVLSFTDNATNEDTFYVYRDGIKVKELSAKTGIGSMGGSVGGMSCNENHSYFVRAHNSAGDSAPTETKSARTNAC